MESKKSKKANMDRFQAIFLNIGLLVSISIAITAFEWKTLEDIVVVDLGTEYFEEFIDPKIIDIPPPEPPKPKIMVREFIETEEPEVELPDEIVFNQDDLEGIEIIDLPEPPVEVAEPGPVTFAEKMPEPIGGFKAFYEYVKKNLKYPRTAKSIGVEGKVFVKFVVDKDGQIIDVEVMKGIGAGCDEEAERVVSEAPKWNPGKQRGVPVKVIKVLPITFKLN
ncbi:MAG: energy transducer TonB [Cyclobacteriaceae bacterium]|nr:energy transducer TonB [Cyclobacteriaceae bacterium]